MRRPEADVHWSAGYRQGVHDGFELAQETVRLQLQRQERALGPEAYLGSDLLLDRDGPRWLSDEGGNGHGERR